MRVLVWQWGRLGAGPRFATLLAEGLADVPGVSVALSLASDAEILRGPESPHSDLTVKTYRSLKGFLARAAFAPFSIRGLMRRIRPLHPDIAVCAMPGPLDLLMAATLRRLRIPFVVLVVLSRLKVNQDSPLVYMLKYTKPSDFLPESNSLPQYATDCFEAIFVRWTDVPIF